MLVHFLEFLTSTGVAGLTYGHVIMISIGLVLVYLAIAKKCEPLLLLPLGFGIILANMPMTKMSAYDVGSLMYYIYKGVEFDLYPPLIFLGLGALTDFYAVLAYPKVILLGAAAQLGIFIAMLLAIVIGFSPGVAAAIGIIGGADGPTAVFVANRLAPDLLAPISIAAYSYIALVPIIQPPIMKLLTTRKERQIQMKALRKVSDTEKILFPIVCFTIITLLVPKAAPLIGCFMLGNLLRESKVTKRLAETAGGPFQDIVTVLLMLSIGSSAEATRFLTPQSLLILLLGVFAFGACTATGILIAKLMNVFSKEPLNPLIGAAGVSAVPASARVAQKLAYEADPATSILFHAMGPNIAGVIGTATAAGVLLAIFGR